MRPYDMPAENPERIRNASVAPALRRLVIPFFALCLVALFLFLVSRPPADFPERVAIEITSGASLKEISEQFKDAHVVRSASLLQFIVHTLHGNALVHAGIYEFDTPQSAFSVARLITSGEYGVPLARVTVPEGLRSEQIDTIVADAISGIAPGDFTRAAAGKEGYLFPETYFVSKTTTAEDMVRIMTDMFTAKIEPLTDAIDASPHTLQDIIIMSSILEGEANDPVSKGLVSGILWERLAIGMPLQVDAPFLYILNKSNGDLEPEDLEVDSPYNTYLYKGLPPGPINNPGLESIRAALSPTPSPYLYYITGNDGVFRYAETFEGHKRNIERYLR